MRPHTTELEEMFVEEWSASHERTTEWTPKYLQALRVRSAAPAPHELARAAGGRSDLFLYLACGAVALALGLLSSRALAPLIMGAQITLPKELLEDSSASELSAPRATHSLAAAALAKESSRTHKSARPRAAAAKSHHQSRSLPPLKAASKCPAPVERADEADPSAPADLDLMDAPSSPMELRALASSRARSAQLIDMQRQRDPMGQLDVMQDPGVSLGTLRINSRPWSEVFIDDKPVGTTPLLNVSVSAGQHSIRLVNKEFGMRKTFDISVSPGESISHVVSLDD